MKEKIETYSFSLSVPTSEKKKLAWLQDQTPETVAAVLCLGEVAYRYVHQESTSVELTDIKQKSWDDWGELKQRHLEEILNLRNKIEELEHEQRETSQKHSEAMNAASKQEHFNIVNARQEEAAAQKQMFSALLTVEQERFKHELERKSLELENTHNRVYELQECNESAACSFERKLKEARLEYEKSKEEALEHEIAKSKERIRKKEEEEELERREIIMKFEKRIENQNKIHGDEIQQREMCLSALRNELDGWRGKEAQIRLEESERQTLLYEKTVNSLKEEHKAERERTLTDCEEKAKILRQEMEYHKTQAEQLRTAMTAQSQAYASTLEKYTRPSHTVAEVGKEYERLVFHEFAKMRPMGELRDTSGNKQDGFADYDWYNPRPAEGGCPLNCLVEVKATLEIHSIKDREKFERDVAAGTKSGRINAAILLSLRCRVQNTNRIDVQISPYGIPVMTASKDEGDGFECEELIQLCFLTFCQMWPLLCKQRQAQGGIEATITAVVNHLNEEIESIAKLSKEIDAVFKSQESIRNALNRMNKEKEKMKDRIENLRLNYNALNSETLSYDEDCVNPEDVTKLQEYILEFHSKRRRLPNTFAILEKAYPDMPGSLLQCFDQAKAKTSDMLKRAAEDKKQQTLEKKRKLNENQL